MIPKHESLAKTLAKYFAVLSRKYLPNEADTKYTDIILNIKCNFPHATVSTRFLFAYGTKIV